MPKMELAIAQQIIIERKWSSPSVIIGPADYFSVFSSIQKLLLSHSRSKDGDSLFPGPRVSSKWISDYLDLKLLCFLSRKEPERINEHITLFEL